MNAIHGPRRPGLLSGMHLLSALLPAVLLCADMVSAPTLPAARAAEQAKITVSTNLVVLPVSVTDAQGEFVSGLQEQNFSVYEEGRLQRITLFVEEDTPVTVGLLVDHSRSMGPKLPEVVTAVTTFAHSSNPADEMFVVDFSDKVSIGLLDGKAFTSDPKVLEKAVAAVSARGQTALYDAVAAGLKHLELGKQEKKALILVSDGGDNASHYKYGEVLTLARQAHAVIYSIALAGDSGEEENPRVLERLCNDTGGIAFFPRAGQKISEIAKEIARDLREQYTLGYAPEKRIKGDSFRKIKVRVTAPGRGKVRVRTRAGYSLPPEKVPPTQPNGGRQ
ncbi:MAG: VWA domain-containing protein [Acidobacteriia bacterium]|nr:VWA domain-containing protein [Terriglobia bacterium]